MSAFDRYFIFDEPIPYKELFLKPVRLRDYLTFYTLAQCLLLEKNSIPDIKIITMTYLEYMFYLSKTDSPDNNVLMLFHGLLRLVLGEKDNDDFEVVFGFDKNQKPVFAVNNVLYDATDFDNLRNIIAEQNDLELPDETIQKDVRNKMEEARRLRQKINNSKIASFEEQIVALSLYSGWDFEKIYNLTIRKFFMAIKRANHMLMSNIYLTASMSGFVTFKNKDVLKGWLADISESNKNSDVLMSLDSIQNKINFNEAKEK